MSASKARQTFPRLVRTLTDGRSLANSTIEGKIRKAYKGGISSSDLSTFEAQFDKTRQLKDRNRAVAHYVIENPDRSLGLAPFLDKTSPEVIRLMNKNPNMKVQYLLKAVFTKEKRGEDNAAPTLQNAYLNRGWIRHFNTWFVSQPYC